MQQSKYEDYILTQSSIIYVYGVRLQQSVTNYKHVFEFIQGNPVSFSHRWCKLPFLAQVYLEVNFLSRLFHSGQKRSAVWYDSFSWQILKAVDKWLYVGQAFMREQLCSFHEKGEFSLMAFTRPSGRGIWDAN